VAIDGPAPNVKVRPSNIVSTPPQDGSIFRIVDFPPGCKGEMHRTRSIDYALVMEGEIDMLLDDSEVHLRTGDVLVQQATNHAWVNRGKENCRIAFILIDSEEATG
jgi:quercetin dioxygenase-like cupin family protein